MFISIRTARARQDFKAHLITSAFTKDMQMVNNPPRSPYNQDLTLLFLAKERDRHHEKVCFLHQRSSLHQSRGEKFRQHSQLVGQTFIELQTMNMILFKTVYSCGSARVGNNWWFFLTGEFCYLVGN